MARITKKDPKEELSKFLRHDEERNQQKEDHRKVSSQLPSLQRERRRSLLTRLGSIIVVCLLVICALAYYVSPYADVSTDRIYGAGDLDAKSLVRASEITASDKVLDSLRSNQKISRKLSKTFPEVGSVKLTLSGLNTLNFKVKERKVIGYVKTGSVYRKILSNGGLGTKALSWSEVDQDAVGQHPPQDPDDHGHERWQRHHRQHRDHPFQGQVLQCHQAGLDGKERHRHGSRGLYQTFDCRREKSLRDFLAFQWKNSV